MRKVLFLASCMAIVAACNVGAQTPKIGFVNSGEIMSQAPGRTEAEAQFDKEMATYRAQIQRMDDSLRIMTDAYDKDAPKLDSATRVTRGKAIQAREDEYQKRAQEMQAQMQQRQNDLVKPILEKINKVLEDIRTEGNYAMIFDVGAQGSPIVAADKNLDITSKVIDRLKASAGTAGTTTRPTGTTQPTGVTRPRQ